MYTDALADELQVLIQNITFSGEFRVPRIDFNAKVKGSESKQILILKVQLSDKLKIF